MGYQWSFGFLLRYTHLFVVGVEVTLAYTAGTVALGLVIGLLIGLGRLSRSRLVNVPLIGLTEVFRCTPLLVQIVWFYYALPIVILGVTDIGRGSPPTLVTVAVHGRVLARRSSAAASQSIERGQWDAARALGPGGAGR